MSITAMAWAWKQDVSPTDKLVLLALADQINDDGVCWPLSAPLPGKCGLSAADVIHVLSRLESIRKISCQTQRDGRLRVTLNIKEGE